MTHETACLDTVIARLEKIERQHRRCKLAGICLLLLGSSLLLLGALASPSRTVKAEHFTLLDPRGNVRARLSTIGDNAALSFHDQQGLTRASLTVGSDGFPGLVFHDQHGEVRVFLGVVDGEPVLGFRDRRGTHRAMVKLGQADGAPLIFVTDTDGHVLWQAP